VGNLLRLRIVTMRRKAVQAKCAGIGIVCLAAGLAVGLGNLAARAQDSAVNVDPRPYGIDLTPGPVKPGNDQLVTTTDADGKPVVGRVHVRVGDGAVILAPDGQLVVRKADQFSPTDRPFKPVSQDELSARLANEFPGFKIKTTNHYLYVYSTSEEFALGTSRILESMFGGLKLFASAQKIETHDPPTPLVVVMFKTDEEFQKYRRMPEGIVAYYHILSNRVFMYEQSRLAQVRPDLAIQQSISTIAHEGTHQILHNVGVQQRLSFWPMWISEGLAEYLAPTSTGARLKWKGPGEVNDLRMFELEQYLKSEAAKEPDGEMVEHTVLAGRLTSTGYASAWALTHYLAKQKRTEFNAYLREVARLEPLQGSIEVTPPGIVRANRDLFVKHFGEDFNEIETRLIAHLKKQPYTDPFKDSPHFVVTLIASDGRRPQRSVNTFHSPQLAQKWLTETLEKVPAEHQAAAESAIRIFPNRLQAENYAQQWLRGR
jgi:hypothetical protein